MDWLHCMTYKQFIWNNSGFFVNHHPLEQRQIFPSPNLKTTWSQPMSFFLSLCRLFYVINKWKSPASERSRLLIRRQWENNQIRVELWNNISHTHSTNQTLGKWQICIIFIAAVKMWVELRFTYLSNVHSTRRLKTIIANGLWLLCQKIHQLILLYALLPNTPNNLELFLQTHPKTSVCDKFNITYEQD